MRIRAFITHKVAERFADCQDYFDINPQQHTIAVADGMSQSMFPQWWAEILAKAYTSDSDILSRIKVLQNKWSERVKTRIEEKEAQKPGSAWRIEDNLLARKGAGATFCGISFDNSVWTCFVLGDTSIIEVDKDYHIIDIINTNKDGFSNHPDYFDSLKPMVGDPIAKSGTLDDGRFLMIVSDPLGELFDLKLKNCDEQSFTKELFSIATHQEFQELVTKWRENEHMHNDDTTCIIIENDDKLDFECVHVDGLDELIASQTILEPSITKIAEDIAEETAEETAEATPQPKTNYKDTRSAENDHTQSSAIDELTEDATVMAGYLNFLLKLIPERNKLNPIKFRSFIPTIKALINKGT